MVKMEKKKDKKEKKEDWQCKHQKCGKKYSSQSSLYNHIRIKHPEQQRRELIYKEDKKQPGRPRKENNKDKQNCNQIQLTLEEKEIQEVIIGYYENPLWCQLILEFQDHILQNPPTKPRDKSPSLFIDIIEINKNDLSTQISEKERQIFIRQVNMFSQSLEESQSVLDICKAIILFKFLESSQEIEYQQKYLQELLKIDDQIKQKICLSFCQEKCSSCCYKQIIERQLSSYY